MSTLVCSGKVPGKPLPSSCYRLPYLPNVTRVFTRLEQAFHYIPLTKPRTPSLIVQEVYSDGGPLPRPFIEPRSWVTGSTFKVCGTVFGRHYAEVDCTVRKTTLYPRTTLMSL